jgi:hypothetical protein
LDLVLPGDVQWHGQTGGVLQNDWKLDAEFFKIFDDSNNKIVVTSSVITSGAPAPPTTEPDLVESVTAKVEKMSLENPRKHVLEH